MRIGIVGGTGKEGVGLGQRWAQAGHEVIIGSRDAERARAKAAELAASGGRVEGKSNRDAARAARGLPREGGGEHGGAADLRGWAPVHPAPAGLRRGGGPGAARRR